MSVALYRKYRSKSLDELVGQSHVTDVLKAAIKNNNFGHAYLLTGPRGVGKTSVARILAHEINHIPYENESNHIDIIEIDAASNNGVDHIRDLRDKARIAPSLAKYKVYIIDEVHMLSKSAFNALLKILEEPPEHVIFILATTDYHKLPDTIISRTQTFRFGLVSEKDIATHLKSISKNEKIEIDDEALRVIAKRGRGSFRDSISLFDQLQSAYKKINAETVYTALGLVPLDILDKLIDSAHRQDHKNTVQILNQLLNSGVTPTVIADQILGEIREQLANKPGLIYILHKLADVETASHPDVALLVALIPEQSIPAPQPNTRPVQTQAEPVVAEKVVLSPPVIPTPISTANTTTVEAPKSTPVSSTINEPTQTYKSKVETKPKTPTQSVSTPVEDTHKPAKEDTPAEFNGTPGSLENLDFKAVVEKAQEMSVGLFSLISGCGYEVKNNHLILYTGSSFKKKKLEDAKLRPMLSQAVNYVTRGEVSIIIESGKKPPEDSRLAKVAELMGGGEEVDVN